MEVSVSKCSVCLKENSDNSTLVNICETDGNNVKWSYKLSLCVPEVEWSEEYVICNPCIQQLEVAYAFRDLCLQSTIVRKRQWQDDLTNKCNSTSPEHIYEDNAVESASDVELKDAKIIIKDNISEAESSDSEIIKNVQKTFNQCKYCGAKFSTRRALAKHNKEKHCVDRPHDCSYCDKSFKTTSDLSHHQKIHFNERDYECNICRMSYNTVSVLHKHKLLKHTDEEQWKYHCRYCNKKFPIKYNRDSHIIRHHPDVKEEFICFHCNKVFNAKLMLISHIRVKHGTKKYMKQCDLCQNVYINQIVLEDHMRKEHGIGTTKLNKRRKQYECTKCSKLYTTQRVMKLHYLNCDGIKRHIKTEQPEIETDKEPGELAATDFQSADSHLGSEPTENDEKPILPLKIELETPILTAVKRGRKRLDQTSNVCQICGMVFNTRYLAKRHVRNVHATEKNYQCDVCQQKFASPVYLNAHKRYHSGERSHICSFCGKGFITGSDLYHHEKIHANKRAYKCDKCPKAFNTSSDLHKHKLCVHQDRSEWKYICTFCERRFPLKTNLDAHTKTHTGERNFKCHLCDRRCVNRSVLLRHIKSHSNVRLYKCAMCNTEYKYQKSLDIHMTKVHGIGDAKIPERIKKYFCHICPKSYFANNKLQKHIRTHTGERPFSCQICEKRFIDKSYVKQHLKSAHNVIFNETDLK